MKTFEVGPDLRERLMRLPADVDQTVAIDVRRKRVVEFPRLPDVRKVAAEPVFIE